MPVKAVFFDVGGTLADETRQWDEWADFLGVPRLAFFGALGAVIERHEPCRKVFEMVRPGLSYEEAKRQGGTFGWLTLEDFYPDALPCLKMLRDEGYLLSISGNQPAEVEELLRSLEVRPDVVASSTSWGVEKPDPKFSERIIQETGLEPEEIAYVGDRLDNDVLPALKAGMQAVFIRCGPWGFVHASWPEVSRATLRLESLEELPDALRTL
ncbi:MAG: haloacid dehalogenase [Meiothermus sp.]